MRIKGVVSLKVLRNGEIVHKDEGRNLVTQVGKNRAAANFESATGVHPTHIALGSGASPPDESNTVLDSEIAGSRTAASSSDANGDLVELAFSVTGTAGWIMRELGIFTAAAGGELLSRFLTQEFAFQTGDTLEVSWSLQFGV